MGTGSRRAGPPLVPLLSALFTLAEWPVIFTKANLEAGNDGLPLSLILWLPDSWVFH